MVTTPSKPLIPPLAPDTSGRWLDVVSEDEDMIRRWLNVMYQMDGHYKRETVGAFRYCMAHRPSPLGASYYYWTPRFEVVLRLVYYPVRQQHQVLSVGFVGQLSPEEAIELVLEQVVVYLRERDASSTFAVVPSHMENARILAFYALVPKHPRLRVTVEATSENGQRWNIEIPELSPA